MQKKYSQNIFLSIVLFLGSAIIGQSTFYSEGKDLLGYPFIFLNGVKNAGIDNQQFNSFFLLIDIIIWYSVASLLLAGLKKIKIQRRKEWISA